MSFHNMLISSSDIHLCAENKDMQSHIQALIICTVFHDRL